MPIQSMKLFEEIIQSLSVLRYIFKSRSKLGLFDLNKKAEMFYQCILNETFAWNLQRLENFQKNYPAVDLGDFSARICVQVTAENRSTKIKGALITFSEKELHKKFDRLIFLMLTEKKEYTANFKQNDIDFDRHRDIFDVDDLLEKIEALNLDAIKSLHRHITSELPGIVSEYASPDSLLRKLEGNDFQIPKNAHRFLQHLGYEQQDSFADFVELCEMCKKIGGLPRKSREFLYIFLINSTKVKERGSERNVIEPRRMESLLGESSASVRAEFQILENAAICSVYEMELQPPVMEASMFLPESGIDALGELVSFVAGSKDQLKEIIVERNFARLDG